MHLEQEAADCEIPTSSMADVALLLVSSFTLPMTFRALLSPARSGSAGHAEGVGADLDAATIGQRPSGHEAIVAGRQEIARETSVLTRSTSIASSSSITMVPVASWVRVWSIFRPTSAPGVGAAEPEPETRWDSMSFWVTFWGMLNSRAKSMPRRRRRGRSGGGEEDPEGRAISRAVGHLDVAAALLDDAVDRSEPEPGTGPGGLGGDEGLEDPAEDLRVGARALPDEIPALYRPRAGEMGGTSGGRVPPAFYTPRPSRRRAGLPPYAAASISLERGLGRSKWWPSGPVSRFLRAAANTKPKRLKRPNIQSIGR